MTEFNKKYDPSKNEILVGLWKTRNGHYKTMPVDNRGLTNLKNVKEGDTLIIRNRTEASIAKSSNPETAPVAYLERVPADNTEQNNRPSRGL